MQNSIVLTEFEADAIQLAMERRAKAEQVFLAAHKAAQDKMAKAMEAHGLPAAIPDGISVKFATVDGRQTLAWDDGAPALVAVGAVEADGA